MKRFQQPAVFEQQANDPLLPQSYQDQNNKLRQFFDQQYNEGSFQARHPVMSKLGLALAGGAMGALAGAGSGGSPIAPALMFAALAPLVGAKAERTRKSGLVSQFSDVQKGLAAAEKDVAELRQPQANQLTLQDTMKRLARINPPPQELPDMTMFGPSQPMERDPNVIPSAGEAVAPQQFPSTSALPPLQNTGPASPPYMAGGASPVTPGGAFQLGASDEQIPQNLNPVDAATLGHVLSAINSGYQNRNTASRVPYQNFQNLGAGQYSQAGVPLRQAETQTELQRPAYIQAQTATEQQRPALIQAQTTTEQARPGLINSQADLARAGAEMKRFLMAHPGLMGPAGRPPDPRLPYQVQKMQMENALQKMSLAGLVQTDDKGNFMGFKDPTAQDFQMGGLFNWFPQGPGTPEQQQLYNSPEAQGLRGMFGGGGGAPLIPPAAAPARTPAAAARRAGGAAFNRLKNQID